MSLWFEKIIVRFFMAIDTVLFNFIGTLYDLLIAISRTSILSQGDIASFAARIELLLGIFMLFKVSFSLITYIVNPDDFSDSSKGFGKLIQNSVISLVMLVLVPYIFQLAFNLQAKILDDNILAKLILGEKINSSTTSADSSSQATILDSAGNSMAFYVMLPFFSPNYAVEGLSSCLVLVDETGSFNNECREALKDAGLNDYSLDNYTYGIQNKSLGLTFRAKTAITLTAEAEDEGEKADQHFVIAYQKPLSTVTAVVVCLLLISFCIDVGVRSVKLAFLQLIYPIPVISYMDPKSGKDGMFSKWYKMCLSTFLSLFIRLLALYFGIYIISRVSDFGMYDIINGSQITNGWVKIFIIVGVLMFIKQLPKILENMGFKLEGDGKFTLNPLKKLEEGAVGGKILKKPNEMLGKMGRGALLAAPHALQTGGKKLIGGIDSKRNGGTFKHGFNNTHGRLYNSFYKKLDEWAPDSAEARKNRMKGEKNQELRDLRERVGKPMSTSVNDAMDAAARARGFTDGDDWKKNNYSSYARAKYAEEVKHFKSAEYKNSYSALAKAKIEASEKNQIADDANQKYQALLNGQTVEFNGVTYHANSVDQANFKKVLDGVKASAASAEGKVNNAKAKHEDVQLKHGADANLEKAYDEFGKSHEWRAGAPGSSGSWV